MTKSLRVGNLDKVFLPWLGIALILGYAVDWLNLSPAACVLCENIAKYVPAIDYFSHPSRTEHGVAARYIWTYFICTAPLVFILLVLFSKGPKSVRLGEIRRSDLILYGVIFAGVMGASLLLFGTFGYLSTDTPSSWNFGVGRIYYSSIIGVVMLAGACWAVPALFMTVFFHSLIQLMFGSSNESS